MQRVLAHLERTSAQPKQPELPLGARALPVPTLDPHRGGWMEPQPRP